MSQNLGEQRRSGLERSEAFESRLYTVLVGSGFKVIEQPNVNGLRPDFIVHRPDGARIIVEAKVWTPTQQNVRRAAEQAKLFSDQTGADAAFVVIDGLPHSNRRTAVVPVSDVVDSIISAPLRGVHPKDRKRLGGKAQKTRTVFAAMPFARAYDDVFFVAMSYAAKSVGAVAVRVDEVEFVGDIPNKIRKMIRASSAVIADVSGAKPNVMYEVGFAHARRVPTVHICSTPLAKLPFDVSHDNTLKYDRGQTHKLRSILAKRLKAVIGSTDKHADR